MITETMNFDFEYISPFEVEVEESAHNVAMITGTLISEGVSRNGNEYTIETMKQIAETAIGVPIYYGTETRINPNDGKLTLNMHKKDVKTWVGEITETWLDPIARKVKFRAHILGNETFPNLIQEIKKGWGVSIGGKGFGEKFWDVAGRQITKLFSMIVNHVQLLSPDMPKGVSDAEVETAEPKVIEESLTLVVEEEQPQPIKLTIDIHI
jgi:hypothetical protein